ncbi:MAG: class II fructose-bisphosphatase [bacterium]
MMLRQLTLDTVRLTELAAIAASRYMGWGDKNAADQAAVDAMRDMFSYVPVDGTVVIGEGEKDQAPMLYIGEKVGTGDGPAVDVAVDPLEGTTIVARGGAGALCVLALGPRGSFLHAPDVYMMKIAVGPDARGAIDLEDDFSENVKRVAALKDKPLQSFTCVLLDRPRNAELIKTLRSLHCRIKLIDHGDVSASLATCLPESGIDMLAGIGNSAEGVLSAAALQCFGGDFQSRLNPLGDRQYARLEKMGIDNLNKIYRIDDLASGDDLLFSCTGVTDGDFLDGVRYDGKDIITHSMVLRSSRGTRRVIRGYHSEEEKFKDSDMAPLVTRF